MIDKDIMSRTIEMAFNEDVGTGDITTLATIPEGRTAKGKFIAKEDGVLCGMNVVKAVFKHMSDEIIVDAKFNDGDYVSVGDTIAYVKGPAIGVLTSERIALNFMQRLSGIATRTKKAVDTVAEYKARIIDTRKTTPGLRVFEKYAVATGGGGNHRFNLADGILIKDNHIKAAGGITAAVNAAKQNAPHTLKIEVEVETMDEVSEAIEAGADIIMLDNMDNEMMTKAVEFIAGRALTEASGNMGDKDLAAAAATGVDFISIGALTHTVRALDISLKFLVD